MELESLAADNSIFVAPSEGMNFNMGKPEETQDGGTIKMRFVSTGGRKLENTIGLNRCRESVREKATIEGSLGYITTHLKI
jgi:hypothetical protein